MTVGGNSLELVSGVAGTPSLSFSGATGSAAGGAAVKVEEEEVLERAGAKAGRGGGRRAGRRPSERWVGRAAALARCLILDEPTFT